MGLQKGLQKTGNNHSDFLTKFAESQAEKIAQQPAPAQAAPAANPAIQGAIQQALQGLQAVDDGTLTNIIQQLTQLTQQQGGQQAQGLGAGYEQAFGPGMAPDGRGETM